MPESYAHLAPGALPAGLVYNGCIPADFAPRRGVAPVFFRVLGAIEVAENGTALPLGGPRQRSVLADLVLLTSALTLWRGAALADIREAALHEQAVGSQPYGLAIDQQTKHRLHNRGLPGRIHVDPQRHPLLTSDAGYQFRPPASLPSGISRVAH
jgi:hypothetical protein